MLKKGFDRSVCTLAVTIHALGPEVIRERSSENGGSELYPIDSIIAQVVLLCDSLGEYSFLSQLALALERVSDFDKCVQNASHDHLDLVNACDEVVRSGKDLTFPNVWSVLMEEPFNWFEKFKGGTDAVVRAKAHTGLKRIGIEFG